MRGGMPYTGNLGDCIVVRVLWKGDEKFAKKDNIVFPPFRWRNKNNYCFSVGGVTDGDE